MKRYAVAVASATVMLVVGGCGESAAPEGSSSPTAAEPEESVTRSEQPNAGAGGSSDEPRGAAADAVRDLARRLGVEASQIRVVTHEEVTWRDGSMGCPRPGMLYPQVLTDGTRVVLEVDGERYEYHAGGRRTAFLCENPEPPAEG
jgi:hypothetical protein